MKTMNLRLKNLTRSQDSKSVQPGWKMVQGRESAEDISQAPSAISVLFKKYVEILSYNGENFFSNESGLTREMATQMLQSQIDVTEQLSNKVKQMDDKDFHQFLSFVDIKQTATSEDSQSKNQSRERSEAGEKGVFNRLPSYGSFHNDCSIKDALISQKKLTDDRVEAFQPGQPLVLRPPEDIWQVNLTQSQPPPNFLFDSGSLRESNDKLILSNAKAFCDFQSNMNLQLNRSTDSSQKYFTFLPPRRPN